jgi:hypothetical protein
MKMGVSEVARILGADRNLVKKWAFHFKEHLTQEASPSKGIPRKFTPADLQVFAYVSTYWEDDPDFDNIKAGLNYGDHQREPYDDLLTLVSPLFQEPPEELDETWRHGSLVGGMVYGAFDLFTLADSYKLAGDMLVDAALSTVEAYELIYPIMYNYRHATELYLKDVRPPKNKTHDLQPLLQTLRDYLKREHATVIPAWFENVVLAFADFDPRSTAFRYSDSSIFLRRTDSGEFWIDLAHVKKLMGWVAESFQRIRQARKVVI